LIAIVSSHSRERNAFAALCENRGWPCTECDSVHSIRKLLGRFHPRVVLTRHKLSDGYSDDVIRAVSASSGSVFTKIIVLLPAGTPSTLEARQVTLGADCVQRDPVRTDVVSEYVSKYLTTSKQPGRGKPGNIAKPFQFAGARVHPAERTLQRGKKFVRLTPREIELSQLLAQSDGEVSTYEFLYGEILGRKFRGDTSNLRVLLNKLDLSARGAGVAVRDWIQVIPKLGYRYQSPGTDPR
jgi:DNA-binding response OmpR family regulator